MKTLVIALLVVAAAHAGYVALEESAINGSIIAGSDGLYGILRTITPTSGRSPTYIVENLDAIEKATRETAIMGSRIEASVAESKRADESTMLLKNAIEEMKTVLASLKVQQAQLETLNAAKIRELNYAESQATKLLMPPWVVYALIFAFACIITLPLWKNLIYSSGKQEKNVTEEMHRGSDGESNNVQSL